jgi:hypothetical protein
MAFPSLRPTGLLLVALAGCAHGTARPSRSPVTQKELDPKHDASRSFGPAAVDLALRERWKAAGVVPASRADDATFLRRTYVDLVGTVPRPEVTASFLADASPDKRARLVDVLLASPDYAAHWMNYWDDVLMGRETKNNLTDRAAFRHWLRARFAENAPWDRLVRDLVAATGQNGSGGPKLRGSAMQIPMGSAPPENVVAGGGNEGPAAEDDGDDVASINGAVNWTLRFEQTPQDLGGSAARVFLGVQIQCAQCHDHKTESWKQDDFRRFSSAFLHAKVQPIDGRQKGVVKRVDLVDAASAPPRFTKNAEVSPLARARAAALDGTDLEKGTDTRKALAAWMTAKDNPWFAKALVNRMWGHLLGRGFYDPVDDIRPSNLATAPELLERLAADFAAHDFDVKRLLRTICATEVYQLAASGSATVDPENRLWGRFHLVPLGPEELMNAIFRVTDLEKTAQRAGIGNLDALRADVVRQYAFLFDTDEEDDEPDYSGTVSQALALLNGTLVAQGSRMLSGSAIAELVSSPAPDAVKVDALAVRVLARHATPEESDRWVKYVEAAERPDHRAGAAVDRSNAGKPSRVRGPLDRLGRRRPPLTPRQAAYEDLLWSLLNSSEFTFNH